MKYFDQGSLFRVTMIHHDVSEFMRKWPCSGLKNWTGVSFTFEKRSGDLVDSNEADNHPHADGSAIEAMMDDCKAYGMAKLAKQDAST